MVKRFAFCVFFLRDFIEIKLVFGDKNNKKEKMGLKGCQITLDNPWNTYYAGQTVNGKVVFTFDSPKKIRGKNKESKKFLCL